MKKLIVFALLSLVSTTSFAARGNFFECSGFADVDEYRVGVNLDNGKAGFFDNDSTAYLSLTNVSQNEGIPPEVYYTFESKIVRGRSHLRLDFNATQKTASLVYISARGERESYGTVQCLPAVVWDDLR